LWASNKRVAVDNRGALPQHIGRVGHAPTAPDLPVMNLADHIPLHPQQVLSHDDLPYLETVPASFNFEEAVKALQSSSAMRPPQPVAALLGQDHYSQQYLIAAAQLAERNLNAKPQAPWQAGRRPERGTTDFLSHPGGARSADALPGMQMQGLMDSLNHPGGVQSADALPPMQLQSLMECLNHPSGVRSADALPSMQNPQQSNRAKLLGLMESLNHPAGIHSADALPSMPRPQGANRAKLKGVLHSLDRVLENISHGEQQRQQPASASWQVPQQQYPQQPQQQYLQQPQQQYPPAPQQQHVEADLLQRLSAELHSREWASHQHAQAAQAVQALQVAQASLLEAQLSSADPGMHGTGGALADQGGVPPGLIALGKRNSQFLR